MKAVAETRTSRSSFAGIADNAPWRTKKPDMAGITGEVSFRAVFVLMMQHAAFAGQLRRATH
jgi:hypothetical protein